MANQHIQPDELWPSAQYGFSQVVVSTGTKIIHCAGQTAWDKDMNLVGGDDLEKQMVQSLQNVKTALAAVQSLQNVKTALGRGRYPAGRGASRYLPGGLQRRQDTCGGSRPRPIF